MNKISDFTKEQEAANAGISASLDAISEGIKKLDKQIADFNNSPDKITDADQKALDSIQAASKALLAKAQGIQTNAEDGQETNEDGTPKQPEPPGPSGVDPAFRAANAVPGNPARK